MKRNVLRLCLVFLGCCSVVLLPQKEAWSAEKTLKVLASTFPSIKLPATSRRVPAALRST